MLAYSIVEVRMSKKGILFLLLIFTFKILTDLSKINAPKYQKTLDKKEPINNDPASIYSL